MHQSEITLHPVFEADEQLAKAIVPRCGALDDPAPRGMGLTMRNALPAAPDVRRVPTPSHRRGDLGGIVASVQTEMLWIRRCRTGPLHADPVQRLDRGPDIVRVGGSFNPTEN